MTLIREKETKRRKLNVDFDTTPSIHHKYNYKISRKYIKNKRVLDIGCWSGQFEKLAIKSVSSIVGIDPGKDAIKFASNEISDATFKVGNAQNLKFKDKSLDTVVFVEVIEHLPNGGDIKALKEISRVLVPNGTLILSTPNKHLLSILLDPAYFLIQHRHYSVKQLEKMLSATGFEIIHVSKTGGIFTLMTVLLNTFAKHILKMTINYPTWIKKQIETEYKDKGFATIHIIAKKVV